MKVEASIKGVRAAVKIAKKAGKTIGFVPTMGNLHAGHIALVKQAKARCDHVVVSIFVNPTQFGENEDLENYPRTLDADYEKLTDAECDLVFVPSVQEMYATMPPATTVQVGEIANQLCGASRAGHFDGVATVVTRLFNIVQPDMALFGEKDYQQLAIIRQITRDLAFDVDILGVPTVREESGLALSSRNGYLTDAQKAQAAMLSKCLERTGKYLQEGIKSYAKLTKAAVQHLASQGFDVDYLAIKNLDLTDADDSSTDFVVLVAAKLGDTRLIDNMRFSVAD